MIRGISVISITAKGARAIQKMYDDAEKDTPEKKRKFAERFMMNLSGNKHTIILDIKMVSSYEEKIVKSIQTMQRFGLKVEKQTAMMGYIDLIKNEVMKQMTDVNFTEDYNIKYLED